MIGKKLSLRTKRFGTSMLKEVNRQYEIVAMSLFIVAFRTALHDDSCPLFIKHCHSYHGAKNFTTITSR